MRLIGFLAVIAWSVWVSAGPTAPIADIHTHYKWTQAEVTSPREAIDALRAQNVVLAVVIGSPAEYALKLETQDPDRIVPIFGPYSGKRDWYTWVRDPTLVDEARAGLSSGQYQGIGELHLIGGYAPAHDRAGVIDGLMKLGAEFRKPVLLHTEFSHPKPFVDLCRLYPDTPILWAHAGAVLTPQQVREAMETCPQVFTELSARDPWRFVRNPVSHPETGRLLPAWERLVMDFPERFLVGSDPVWPVDRMDAWDQPDRGWENIGRFLDFHRRWLSFLPKRERKLIRLENAQRLFGTVSSR